MTVAAQDTAASLPADSRVSGAPIEVTHVITSLDVGGAETMLTRLVTGDTAGFGLPQGDQPEVGRGATRTCGGCGDSVRDLAIGRRRGALRGLARLTGIIRSTQPAVVHSWLYHADLLATLALALSGRRRATRLVWGVRCSDMDMRRYARSTRYVLKLLPASFVENRFSSLQFGGRPCSARAAGLPTATLAGRPERPGPGQLSAPTGRARRGS